MAKLTDSQLVILNGAAQRKDGAVLPLPKSLKLNKAAATMVLKSLITRRLVSEQPVTKDDEVWRENGEQRLTLRITDSGLKAIGADEDSEPAPEQPAAVRAVAAKKSTKAQKSGTKNKARPKTAAARTGTKQALLIEMLSRKNGATVPEIVKATGWQAHSVRGAMSGSLKKKQGLTVTSTRTEERGRVYRIEC